MVKYGKVSDREMQQCFHARMITIITVKGENFASLLGSRFLRFKPTRNIPRSTDGVIKVQESDHMCRN